MRRTLTPPSFVGLLAVIGLLVSACAPATPPAPTQPPAAAAKPTSAPAAAPAAQPTAAPAAPVATTAPAAKPAQAPAAAAGTPRRGGTLVYASTADVLSLDPTFGGGVPSAAVRYMLYNGLVKYT